MFTPIKLPPSGQSLLVQVYREPYTDFFVLTTPDGKSEELTVEETKEWFLRRGTEPVMLERAMDFAWEHSGVMPLDAQRAQQEGMLSEGNRRPYYIEIKNYREPKITRTRTTPEV